MAFVEKYVTSDSDGGDGSSGNPWTLAEAIAAAAAGDRVNVLVGSYALGAATFPTGTVAAPIVFRGYHETVGDLDGRVRNADTTLNTTDFPVLTLSAAIVPSPFCVLQNILINNTGNIASALINSGTVDYFYMIGCSVLCSSNHASARILTIDNYSYLISCDFECSGAAHGSVVVMGNNAVVFDCRFKGVDTDALLTVEGGAVISSVFIGNGESGANTGISQIGSNQLVLLGNTLYHCTIGISAPNEANSNLLLVVNNHVTDCGEFLKSLYSAANLGAIELNNRTRDNGTHSTGLLSIVAGEVAGGTTGDISTDYVDAGGTPPNLRLITTAPAKGAGLPAYTDIGAFQREEAAAAAAGGSYTFIG